MKRTTALAVIVLTALLCTTLLGVVLAVRQNAQQLNEQRHQAHAACVESNKLRDGERGLWNLIVKLSKQHPQPRPTKQQQQEAKIFFAYVNTTFAHVDCSAPVVTPGPSATPTTIPAPASTKTLTRTKTVRGVRTIVVTRIIVRTRTVTVCRRPNGKPC